MAFPLQQPAALPPANPVAVAAAVPPPAGPPAPGGVGAAPTQLHPQQPAPAPEIGYIETGVLAIKDFIVAVFSWLYSNLCCCFTKKQQAPPSALVPPAPPPLAPLPPPPVDPRLQPHRELLQRMRNAFRSEEIRQQFEVYYDELEREEIYFQLGQSAPLSWSQSFMHGVFYTANYGRQQKVNIGKQMAERNPALLMSYLMRKVEQLANPH